MHHIHNDCKTATENETSPTCIPVFVNEHFSASPYILIGLRLILNQVRFLLFAPHPQIPLYPSKSHNQILFYLLSLLMKGARIADHCEILNRITTLSPR